MKHLTVTAAILIEKNEILCMQRGPGKYPYISYKYEFPGGKLEPGESHEECLRRELQEEMDIHVDVKPEHFFMTVDYTYDDFSITMHSYLCPVQSRHFVRKEHVDHKWMPAKELHTLDWAPADIPIMKKLMGCK